MKNSADVCFSEKFWQVEESFQSSILSEKPMAAEYINGWIFKSSLIKNLGSDGCIMSYRIETKRSVQTNGMFVTKIVLMI